jgi:predicted Zn-dependent peptidase
MEPIASDDVRAFHRATFRPERTAIGVVGSFDPEALTDAVVEAFGSWTSPTDQAAAEIPIPSAPADTTVVLIDKPDQTQAHIQLTQRLFEYGHADGPAIAIVEAVLGRLGLVARLPARIRTQEGLAYYAGTALDFRRHDGTFAMAAQTKSGTALRVIDLMIEELTRFLEDGIQEHELASTRARSVGALHFHNEQRGPQADLLCSSEQFGLGPDYYPRQVDALASMPKEEIEAAARRHLDPKKLAWVVVGPKADLLGPLEQRGPVRVVLPEELNRP